MAGRSYSVQAVEVAQAGGAGISTWDDFLVPPVGRFFHFELETPLVIASPAPLLGGAPSFPVPTVVFAHLADQWQEHGGPAFALNTALVQDWLHEGGCVVTDYHVQGRPVALSHEDHPLGFLGTLTYTCRTAAPEAQQVLTALARFACFAGVGLHTEQGLGITRITIDP